MALTPEGTLLTQAQYQAQLATRATLIQGATAVYNATDVTVFANVAPVAETTALLADAAFATSVAIASDYLVAFAAVEGQAAVTPVIPTALATSQVASTLTGVVIATILRGQQAGLTPALAAQAAYANLVGKASSYALSGGQQTITGSVPRWQRVTGAKPCAFCAMLASRGPVYRESTVRFQSHAHCACTAEPAYSGAYTAANRRWSQLWYETTSGASGRDALNAFRRALS